MAFAVAAVDRGSAARAGSLSLNHGTVETPCFMPVGTNATVKAMSVGDLEDLGVRLILGNAYHLLLRPGPDVIRAAGGLHRFMGWPHDILTDSGGYQVFSLAQFRRLEEGGVSFRSHLDGSSRRLTPEDVVDLEVLAYGSDVLMPLDVCTAPGIARSEAEEALALTTRWLARSRDRWRSPRGAPEGGAVRHHAGQLPPRPARAPAPPGSSRSTCPATPSAGSPSARSSRCSGSSPTSRPAFCPPTSPGT